MKLIVGTGATLWVGVQLLFLGLKLAGVLAWSWWWVLSPVWVFLLLMGGWLAIAEASVRRHNRRMRRIAREAAVRSSSRRAR